MTQVALSELAKIPFLDVANLSGRTIPTMTFFSNGEWQLWLEGPEGLIPIKAWPGEGHYFSAQPEKDSDICVPFIDFIGQRCLRPQVMRSFIGLSQDFYNVCASLKKFDLLFEQSAVLKTTTARLVLTELEYIFTLCRSMFDLLQELISIDWQEAVLIDQSRKKKQLPKTFSGMVLNAESLRSAEELTERFHLPPLLVGFYVSAGPFFQMLRTFRDRYVHGGTTPEIVFVTERGFAVPKRQEPFAAFNVWNSQHMLPNELCSLRPALGYLVNNTLKACNDYASALQTVIACPPPVAPNMHLYVRGEFNRTLQDYSIAQRDCLWWKDA